MMWGWPQRFRAGSHFRDHSVQLRSGTSHVLTLCHSMIAWRLRDIGSCTTKKEGPLHLTKLGLILYRQEVCVAWEVSGKTFPEN